MTHVVKAPRAAMWLNTIDPLFFNARALTHCFVIVVDDTPEALVARATFPPTSIITLTMAIRRLSPTFHDLVFESDLAEKIHSYGVTHLVLPDVATPPLEEWARAHHVHFIASPTRLQKRLENKIYFNTLAKRFGIRTPPTLSRGERRRTGTTYVLQDRNGAGMIGTSFEKALHDTAPEVDMRTTLVREYVPGVPVGVSVLMDRAGHIAFSKLRRQCFTYGADAYPASFLGVQWLPDTFFTAVAHSRIRRELRKIVTLLTQQHFVGIANIDLVVYNDTPYIIECNPRLSSATPHLFALSELCTGADAWCLFLSAFLPHIPHPGVRASAHPSFEGAILQIDAPQGSSLTRLLEIGTYRLRAGTIDFIHASAENVFSHKDRFFLFSDITRCNEKFDRETTVLTIVSSFPLYSKKIGALNKAGKLLREHFTRNLIHDA